MEKRPGEHALVWVYAYLYVALILFTWLAGYQWHSVRVWGVICVIAFSPVALPFIVFAIWGIGGLLLLPIALKVPLFRRAWNELMEMLRDAADSELSKK